MTSADRKQLHDLLKELFQYTEQVKQCSNCRFYSSSDDDSDKCMYMQDIPLNIVSTGTCEKFLTK